MKAGSTMGTSGLRGRELAIGKVVRSPPLGIRQELIPVSRVWSDFRSYLPPWTGRLSVTGNLPSTSSATHHSWVDWRNEKPNALLKATPQRGIELTILVWIPVLRPLHVLFYSRTYRGFRTFVVKTPISYVRSDHGSGQVLATALLTNFLMLIFELVSVLSLLQ